MKRLLILIPFCLIGLLNIKGQNFGLKVDFGLSKLSGVFGPGNEDFENKFGPYYSLGFVLEKIPETEGKLGFQVHIEYNVKGTRVDYNGFATYSNFGDVRLESISTNKLSTISLAFIPLINPQGRIRYFLGPHVDYMISSVSEYESRTYSADNNELLFEDYDRNSTVIASFTDKLSFGIKTGINIKLNESLSSGVMYQYTRWVNNSTVFGEKPFFNTFNLSLQYLFPK